MKMLTSDDYNFRKTVEECNGVGLRIAEKLEISPQAVSARLNSAKHLYWWKQFKRSRSRSLATNETTENEERFPATESAEEIINQTNLKLRGLVIKHRGKLNLVANELGIPNGVDFVEEYLNSDHNRGWWALCRFNPENDFEKADNEVSAQETLPLATSKESTDKSEIALLREQISVLQEEMARYKQVISLYEAAHKMVSTQTHT